MIDPNNPTNYQRSRAELEEFTLFATLVAGKPAGRMALLLEKMLMNARLGLGYDLTPFEIVRHWVKQGILERMLRYHGTGQYARLVSCWTQLTAQKPSRSRGSAYELIDVNLHSVMELEQVHGIGPKTARFIVLHSVRNCDKIPIDTHWIKELRALGKPVRVTTTIGSGGRLKETVVLTPDLYHRYETWAMDEVRASGLTAAEYDLLIWKKWNALGPARLAA